MIYCFQWGCKNGIILSYTRGKAYHRKGPENKSILNLLLKRLIVCIKETDSTTFWKLTVLIYMQKMKTGSAAKTFYILFIKRMCFFDNIVLLSQTFKTHDTE
jgi:hypothetical protein